MPKKDAAYRARRTQEDPLGPTIGRRRFTDEEVREIRRLSEAGAPYKSIAAQYGMSRSMVRFICLRIQYADVE